MSCPIIFNSKTIEHTVQTSCYCGLRLTMCYLFFRIKDFVASGLQDTTCFFSAKKNVSPFAFSLSKTSTMPDPQLICVRLATLVCTILLRVVTKREREREKERKKKRECVCCADSLSLTPSPLPLFPLRKNISLSVRQCTE